MSHALTPRAAFTLTEVLIALGLLGVVMGLAGAVVDRQQRFYAGMTAIIEQRSQLRQGAGILTLDLRSVSSVGGDLLTLSDSAVEVRAHLGSSIVCDTAPGRMTFDLPPAGALRHATLAAFADRPHAGDVVFVYDDGAQLGNADDEWRAYSVSGVTSTAAACASSPYAAAGAPRLRVALGGGQSLTPTTRLGAPARFGRLVRYRLYRAASGEWFLGFSEWSGGGYTVTQPVSGPYRPYAAAGGSSGLSFRFFDHRGAAITGAARAADVARIELRLRAVSSAHLRVDGMRRGPYADSIVAGVALRNRRY